MLVNARVLRGFCASVVLVASAGLPATASASLVSVLDTFASDPAMRSAVAVRADVLSAVEYAMPFSVPSSGRVRQIDTGFTMPLGALPPSYTCGFRVGLIPLDALLSSTAQPGFVSAGLWTDYADLLKEPPQSADCVNGIRPVIVSGAGPVSLSNLDWQVDQGDYALVIAFRSDQEQGFWSTNTGLPTSDALIQVIGSGLGGQPPYPCGGAGGVVPWVSIGACGLAAIGSLEARVLLEVPEPPVGGLLLAGVLVGVARRQRERGA